MNRGFRKHFAWGKDGHGVSVYQLAGSDVTLEVSYDGGRAVVFVPEERALFPWRWSLEALKAKKDEIGATAFTREIMVLPVGDDLSVFPRTLFPPLFDDALTLRPSKADIEARGLSVFMGVDIARSANVGADYFVVFVVGADRHGNHHIIDIRRTTDLAESIGAALIQAAGFSDAESGAMRDAQ